MKEETKARLDAATPKAFVMSRHSGASCSEEAVKLFWPGQGERRKFIVTLHPTFSATAGEGDSQDAAWLDAANRIAGKENPFPFALLASYESDQLLIAELVKALQRIGECIGANEGMCNHCKNGRDAALAHVREQKPEVFK